MYMAILIEKLLPMECEEHASGWNVRFLEVYEDLALDGVHTKIHGEASWLRVMTCASVIRLFFALAKVKNPRCLNGGDIGTRW